MTAFNSRRNFLKLIGATGIGLAAGKLRAEGAAAGRAQVLVDTESFADRGGWVLDQQFMDQMGSPYLMAHGLGEPVKDAVTTVKFPKAGAYRLWVRTKDWVAPWKAPGTPGRFQVLVDGKSVGTDFGIKGDQWAWHDGGVVTVGENATVALHDLTGFNGRCDALVFCEDHDFTPPEDVRKQMTWRRALKGLQAVPDDAGKYDLVVVGGGIAGICAALVSARLGCKVAFVQDREIVGGNGSSEVRVSIEGLIMHEPYPRIGSVVAELDTKRRSNAWQGAGTGPDEQDLARLALLQAEKNITLFLGHRMNGVVVDKGRIVAVEAEDTRTARRIALRGDYFADCTGDGEVGARAGAKFEMTMTGHMGASNLWNTQLACDCKDLDKPLSSEVRDVNLEAPFPRCPWAVDLSRKPFPGRKGYNAQWTGGGLPNLGNWFWEAGFDRHPLDEVELMRDQNLRAMFGAWDALKNVDKLYPNRKLEWAAYIAGKRESRRLIGDVLVSADDFREGKVYEDAAVPCTWHLDLHLPDKRFVDSAEGDPFISRATEGKEHSYKGPYWIPYRALYSGNIDNLFMAGSDISVTHESLGAIRVMRTCGMMGEVVGMAASIAVKNKVSPRGVYKSHLASLKTLMTNGVGRGTPKPGAQPKSKSSKPAAKPAVKK